MIEPVAEGERVSLDYHHAFYDPTPTRQEALLAGTFGFVCRCDRCLAPDDTRGFSCPRRGCPGPVYPPGVDSPETSWHCMACEKTLSVEHVLRRLQAEQRASEERGTKDIAWVDKIVGDRLLLESHHLVWEVLLEVGTKLARRRRACLEGTAAAVWARVLRGVARVYPPWHVETIKFFEIQGQIYVRQGRLRRAAKSFHRAWEISRVCSGPTAWSTRTWLDLATDPPRSDAELQYRYAKAQHHGFIRQQCVLGNVISS
mmetsp:Transcript_16702/g.39661  ORF Transcript_16702/g.39661 Transcript_16702/m.39661 type:complete len:258 (+) Transcript_16702:1-774(+)